jgi:DNA replication protein DnaD
VEGTVTYSSLTSVKEELNISSSNVLYDQELNDLLATIDNYINTRLQRFTSLPLQSELTTFLSDLESRWVCARYRIRRASPQEQQQYQVTLNQIETQFQEFLKNNFQRTFFGQGSESDYSAGIELGRYR